MGSPITKTEGALYSIVSTVGDLTNPTLKWWVKDRILTYWHPSRKAGSSELAWIPGHTLDINFH